ncbi:hypothetical protein MJT46_017329 [Ovis ammon polii x Ovis aries]|nr:hypothetical protein MJT46_017329 [Ovis ammon polii x Ovis aries]
MLTAGLPLDRFRLDFILYKQAQRSEANFPKCHSRKVAETGCEIKNTLSTYLDFSLLKGPCKNYGGNSDSYNGDDGSNTFSEEMSPKLYFYLCQNYSRCIASKCCSEYAIIDQNRRNTLTKTVFRDESEKCLQYDFYHGCERKSSHHQWHLVLACHGNKPIASERHLNRESRDSYRCKPVIIEHESDHGLETDASKLSHFGSCTNNSLRTQSILHKKRYQKQTQCGGLTPMAPEVKMLVPCTAH